MPTFGRRRRRGRVLVPLLVVLVGGGVAGVQVAGSDTVDVDAQVIPTTRPVEAAPSAMPTTSAHPTDPPGSTMSAVEAAARPTPLRGVPALDLAPELAADRARLGPPLQHLQSRIEGVVAELGPSLAGSDVSVAVRDAQGRRIYDRASDRRLLPASTMKSVTAATVLSTLGADHRFTTTVAATGEVVDGVLRGDLVIHGGGDPVLTTEDYRRHVYPSRPSTAIEDLADAVAEQGITTVTGRVVGDSGEWGNAALAAGWRTAYIDDQNARRISGLTVDAGLTVDVEIPPDAPVQVVLHPADDPVRRTADVFAAQLAERGIAVRGGSARTTLPVPTIRSVAAVESPPVGQMLAFMMQRSDNHLADTLLLAASHAATGDGSWAAAGRTATAVLAGLGVDAAGLRVVDGSGLSRLDRLTATQLADLDVAMMAGPHAAAWQDSLAVAGRSGTLRGRLRGTPADGRFLGKTGTLDDVKAVVGHVRLGEAGGQRMHLAVVANGTPAGGQWAVAVLMDRLALELADHLDGCVTTHEGEEPVRTCGDDA